VAAPSGTCSLYGQLREAGDQVDAVNLGTRDLHVAAALDLLGVLENLATPAVTGACSAFWTGSGPYA
jgi:hypothetical protein